MAEVSSPVAVLLEMRNGANKLKTNSAEVHADIGLPSQSVTKMEKVTYLSQKQ
jgi:hypothetical protein